MERYREWWKQVAIQLLFLAITIIMIAPCIYEGKLVANADWLFHASRVEQISQNIHNGQLLTFIASSTFHHTGVGSFLFYPYFFCILGLFLNCFLVQLQLFIYGMD